MRSFRPTLLASAALVLAAACNGDVTAPGAPTIAGRPSLSPFFNTAIPPVESDSVVAGYGCESTGGIDYLDFEYDPETGTECVVSSDTTAPPPPPPPPTTTTTTPTTTTTTTTPTTGTTTTTPPPPAPKDSVQSGYGSGSTGGLEYR